MPQPAHPLGNTAHHRPGGQRGPVDHHHRQPQRAGRLGCPGRHVLSGAAKDFSDGGGGVQRHRNDCAPVRVAQKRPHPALANGLELGHAVIDKEQLHQQRRAAQGGLLDAGADHRVGLGRIRARDDDATRALDVRVGRRRGAGARASSARSLRSEFDTRQPTIFRENTSVMKAT